MIRSSRSLTSNTLYCFLFCCHVVMAQSPPHAIQVISHAKSDSVLLRWAPTDLTAWQLGNKYGYSIERFQLTADGTLQSSVPVKLHACVKPFSKEKLTQLAATHEEAALIQELIYSEEEPLKETGPASILQKHDDLNNRFGMALLACDLMPGIAQAAGLFFSDTTAQAGARYIYKIALARITPNLKIEPGVIVVDVQPAKPLQPFNDLTATFKDKTVTLSWPLMLHKGVYSAYSIERYDEQEEQFKSISGLPYIPMHESSVHEQAHFVDSLVNNAQTYQYRVRGITPFGETGPPSNIVTGTGKDDLSGSIIIRQAIPEKDKIIIRWEFPMAFENVIGGFIVRKSETADGPYQDVTTKKLSPATREFSEAAPVSSRYYQIKAVDANDQELSHSYPYFVHVEDNTPPAVPVGLTGKIDSTGLITFSWKNNTDADLLGYRLFAADDARQEFVEVTREIVLDTTFTDRVNINVLNKDVFFKIVAVDRNYNTSEYSSYVKLVKPDKIKPIAPVFSSITLTKEGVVLSWISSSSNDVARHVLLRKEKGKNDAAQLLAWFAQERTATFTDKTVSPGKKYQYTLQAYDSADNFSAVTSGDIYSGIAIHEAVTDLVATIDRAKKIITLRWKYDKPFIKVNIYRRKGNEPFSMYESISYTPREFMDKQVVVNNVYSYKIQLVLDTGARTELSKELKVSF